MTQSFYTNVQLIGNQFLVRGVENGKRFETRDEFFPTLFVKTKKDSKYRTLSGEEVEPMPQLKEMYEKGVLKNVESNQDSSTDEQSDSDQSD